MKITEIDLKDLKAEYRGELYFIKSISLTSGTIALREYTLHGTLDFELQLSSVRLVLVTKDTEMNETPTPTTKSPENGSQEQINISNSGDIKTIKEDIIFIKDVICKLEDRLNTLENKILWRTN